MSLFFHVAAEIEPWFGRLVVADILCGNTDAVGDVEHESRETIGCRQGGGVDAKFAAFVVAHDDFFAPVT